jgi:valyl-tRNA synthetase
MRNIQDWCISRQLWWGHPIPAYHCDCGHVTVSRERATQCGKCGKADPKPDPDVLDTWFSSALWPFSTLGWPEDTPDLRRFYPTSDMETGSDILFFWVARMMMMGLHFMGEVPFKRILLSGMVTDERGQKMSKVKGNVVDPLDVIHGATGEDLVKKAEAAGAKKEGLNYLRKTYPDGFPPYGADALRMTLLSYSPQTPKIALSIKRIEGYRNFCNKLWNAARYAQMNWGDAKPHDGAPEATLFANRWILSRLAAATDAARSGTDEYRLDEAALALYHFAWDELCAWYVELSKPLLNADDPKVVIETRNVLLHVLEAALRLLHPMMPFVTEEIWQRLPHLPNAPRTIMQARYPEAAHDGRRDEAIEAEMARVQGVVSATRALRAEYDVHPRNRIPLVLRTPDAAIGASLEHHAAAMGDLAGADVTVEVGARGEPPEGTAVAMAEGVTLLAPLADLVDPAKERERLTREIAKLDKDIAAVDKKLSNPNFVERAPAELVERERTRQRELGEQRERLQTALNKLDG